MSRAYWRHYEHPADMGIRGYGETLSQAFEQAALAMVALITEQQAIEPAEQVEIECCESEPDMLLIAWLNRIIYEMSARGMLFSKFQVNIDGDMLKATVWGQRLDIKKHQPAVEVKGATFMDLKVAQTEDGLWMAQCVVDV